MSETQQKGRTDWVGLVLFIVPIAVALGVLFWQKVQADQALLRAFQIR